MIIDIIQPNVNPNRLRRPNRHSNRSLYRDHAHTTQNGRGVVGRLIEREKRKRKQG